MADVTKYNTALGANWAGYGERVLTIETTINTATLIAGDDVDLFRVPNGAKLKLVGYLADDMDTNGSPTFDMDFIAKDDSGDTILHNAGTEFQSAVSSVTWRFLGPHTVIAESNADAYFSAKINTAAATGVAAANLRVILVYGAP